MAKGTTENSGVLTLLFSPPVLTAKRGGGTERPAAFPAPALSQIIRQCPEAFVAGRVVPPPRPAHSGRAAVSFARSANSFCSVRYFAPAVFAAALRFHATPLLSNIPSQTTALRSSSPNGAACSTLFFCRRLRLARGIAVRDCPHCLQISFKLSGKANARCANVAEYWRQLFQSCNFLRHLANE